MSRADASISRRSSGGNTAEIFAIALTAPWVNADSPSLASSWPLTGQRWRRKSCKS
ncbi:MAG: hypothetical protein HYR68_07335 [Burkholderiales bacterium]|nr:hypothetical protein [Burkholderiales bacterium]